MMNVDSGIDALHNRVRGLDAKVKTLVIGAAALVAAAVVANPIVVVPAGHRGVLTTFGRVEGGVLSEGVQKGEGVAAIRDPQHVKVKVALNYRIDPARSADVLQRVGTLPAVGERIILPLVHEVVKAAVAQFTTEELVTQRAEVRARIRAQLDGRLRENGVVVEDLAIVALSFSPPLPARAAAAPARAGGG